MPSLDDLYYAHTMPGLEKVAWTELRARLNPSPLLDGYKELQDKNGLVLFHHAQSPADLLRLRTVEDVFYVIERLPKVEWGREGLTQIYEAMARNRTLEAGVEMLRWLRPHEKKSPSTFRVITRMAGSKQPYRRMDLEQAVSEGLRKRVPHGKWRAVREGGDIEIWANLVGFDFVCGLRLSDETMRHREYKAAHIEASLRPSVAASMAWLAEPQPNDVFLDPLCGAGTVLIERALFGRHQMLLGGDLDNDALRAAVDNFGPRHKPRQLFRWDARHLPLAAQSVTKIATNLPFGVKIGSHAENPILYADFFREAERVLVPSGRVVVLSSEVDLIKATLRRLGLYIVEGHWVTLLGRRAAIYVIERGKSR